MKKSLKMYVQPYINICMKKSGREYAEIMMVILKYLWRAFCFYIFLSFPKLSQKYEITSKVKSIHL